MTTDTGHPREDNLSEARRRDEYQPLEAGEVQPGRALIDPPDSKRGGGDGPFPGKCRILHHRTWHVKGVPRFYAT
jgi:hypothetical protein